MATRPTYEQLAQCVKTLEMALASREQEKNTLLKACKKRDTGRIAGPTN